MSALGNDATCRVRRKRRCVAALQIKTLPAARLGCGSNLRLEAAGADDAPAAHGFKNREESGRHEQQTQPQNKIHGDDAGDQTQRTDDAAGDAALSLEVGLEEPAHTGNLPQRISVASGGKLRHIGA